MYECMWEDKCVKKSWICCCEAYMNEYLLPGVCMHGMKCVTISESVLPCVYVCITTQLNYYGWTQCVTMSESVLPCAYACMTTQLNYYRWTHVAMCMHEKWKHT